MKASIKNLNRITLTGYTLILITVLSALLVTNTQLEHTNKVRQDAQKLTLWFIELEILSNEHIELQSARTEIQWEKQYHKINQLLRQLSNHELIHSEINKLQIMSSLLPDDMVNIHSASSKLAKENYHSNFRSQLQSIILITFKIDELVDASRQQILKQLSLLVFSLFAVIFIFAYLIYILFKRWITYPLKTVVASIENLGLGGLTQKIPEVETVEFNEIATSAEHSRQMLNKLTVSRDELAEEIVKTEEMKNTIERSHQTQQLVNNLLNLSFSDKILEAVLTNALQIILATPFIKLQNKGGIFLTQGEKLHLRSQINLDQETIANCNELQFGECSCGLAASTGSMQFIQADSSENKCIPSTPASNICIPVKHEGKITAVIMLYVGADYPQHDNDREFFDTIAGTMAVLIERKKLEATLNKLAQAVEQSPESIVITDTDANIEYVNKAFILATGYSKEEAYGKNPRILHSGLTPQSTFDDLWKTLIAGKPWKGEFYNQNKEGNKYTEFAIIAPIRQADGTITHYLAVKEDITEKKKLAKELDKHRHHLENLVEQRTQELREAQLAAESANQAKSNFLANMSHEIRTPLNAILGLTHLLRRVHVDADRIDYIDKIQASGNHLLTLITDILDLSKIDAGKLKIDRVSFSLDNIISNISTMLSDQAKDKGIDLLIKSDPVERSVVGDPTRITQILINLVSNAIKFTESGSVSLSVTITGETDTHSSFIFDIFDTGIGMNETVKQGLFKPFFQGESDINRRFSGTGLGLAISSLLVKAMDGEIGVSSQLGEGSHFWVSLTLPLADKNTLLSSIQNTVENAEQLIYENYHGARILLAEDDPINRQVAVGLLTNIGLEVDFAENGEQATELFADGNNYDLVLMDVQMPIMDGLAATRKIRSKTSKLHTPILAMTANAFAEDRIECLNAGMDDVVTKPVDPKVLFSALLKWLPEKEYEAPSPTRKKHKKTDFGDTSQLDNLRSIPGIDINSALKVLNGEVDSYIKLLNQFISTHQDDAKLIKGLLDKNKLDDAVRLAHTLKGACGTLGLSDTATISRNLEAQLKKNEANSTEFQSLLSTLSKNLYLLASIIPTPKEVATEHDDVAPENIEQILSELEKHLEIADTSANEILDTHFKELRHAFGESAITLQNHIDNFDYPAALDCVIQMKSNI